MAPLCTPANPVFISIFKLEMDQRSFALILYFLKLLFCLGLFFRLALAPLPPGCLQHWRQAWLSNEVRKWHALITKQAAFLT